MWKGSLLVLLRIKNLKQVRVWLRQLSGQIRVKHHSHRSVSQKRMSTSWVGHYNHQAHPQVGLHYRAQMESEVK